MNRIINLLLPWLFIIPPAIAQESKSLPNAQELKAANDSILADAYNLYLYEKIAWILEDELTNCQPATINEIAGWIPVGEGEDVVKGIFYNKDKTKALFEATYSFLTSTSAGKAAVRDLSPEEIDMINVREKVLLAVRLTKTYIECIGCLELLNVVSSRSAVISLMTVIPREISRDSVATTKHTFRHY